MEALDNWMMPCFVRDIDLQHVLDERVAGLPRIVSQAGTMHWRVLYVITLTAPVSQRRNIDSSTLGHVRLSRIPVCLADAIAYSITESMNHFCVDSDDDARKRVHRLP